MINLNHPQIKFTQNEKEEENAPEVAQKSSGIILPTILQNLEVLEKWLLWQFLCLFYLQCLIFCVFLLSVTLFLVKGFVLFERVGALEIITIAIIIIPYASHGPAFWCNP